MSDSENIIDGKVIPYSGGRMHTDTSSWRDATDMELEQKKEIEVLEQEIRILEHENVFMETEFTAAQDEIKRLREALEFYADELEWVEYSLLSPVQRDRGKIARQALEVSNE